ncbi:MAG: hypothetical protein JWM11_2705 [Planctomycetaceae bacterium]|nr:hypothetical protein [Planctomycetaceae bacterium]
MKLTLRRICSTVLFTVALQIIGCNRVDPNKPVRTNRKLTPESLKESTTCVQKIYPEYQAGTIIGQSASKYQDCLDKSLYVDRYHSKTVYLLEFHGELPPTVESAGVMSISVDHSTGKVTEVTIAEADF